MTVLRGAIAFGGNLGDPERSFQNACRLLATHGINVDRISSTIRSQPMGPDAGSEFCNAAATFHSPHSAHQLLQILHTVEAELGRTRDQHWGPRTIDLDLICLDQQVIDTPQLVLPHPAFWYRRFVLQPLCEIDPDARHPILKESSQQLLDRLLKRPLTVAVDLCRPENSRAESTLAELKLAIRQQFPQEKILIQTAAEGSTSDAPTITIQVVREDGPSENRRQPRHEKGRIVRIALSSENVVEQLITGVTSVIQAMLG
ncbi:MAG: 2-amino-4-hydroxy-6-hydroxymethyldihydropteridine diphosphokinase [Planctomycetaceae bacterium]